MDQSMRARGVGGSDAAAILGYSPWRTQVDVWMEKTGHPMWRPQAESPAMRWGKILEPVIREQYSRDTGIMVIPAPPRVSFDEPEVPIWAEDGIRFCHPDGVTFAGGGIWEGKTGSRREDWEDGVPIYYRVQVQQYADILDKPWTDVSVLLPGGDFRTYREPSDPAFQADIRQRVQAFWHNHVMAKIPPAGAPAVVVHPEPAGDLTIKADGELVGHVARLLEYQSDIAFWTEAADDLKEQIRAKMGEAAHATLPGYRVDYTARKGPTSIGWEQVAVSLWNTLEVLRRHLVYGKEGPPDEITPHLDPGLYATLQSLYTTTGAPTRPLTVRAIKEKKR